MFRCLLVLAEFLCSSAGVLLLAQQSPGLDERIRDRVKAELKGLSDFVCVQTMQRFVRGAADQAWKPTDTLRWEIAVSGDRELYALAGSRSFDNRTPAEIIGKGTLNTGSQGLLLKHVFDIEGPAIRFQGRREWNGRPAFEFEFDVPLSVSRYALRFGAAEQLVPFQGVFLVDEETLDLVQFEAQAYDMANDLGLQEARTTLAYQRIPVGERNVLMPVSATHFVSTSEGLQSLNRSRLDGCREYRAESALLTSDSPGRARVEAGEADEGGSPELPVLEGVIETQLAAAIRLENASIGQPITATVQKDVRKGDRTLIPQGARLTGRVVRLERLTQPYDLFEVGLELDGLEWEGHGQKVSLTLVDAGPAAGLIRQQKRLDPVFNRRRAPQMNILVREVQRGQGILHWEARRAQIPQGFRMRWRFEE